MYRNVKEYYNKLRAYCNSYKL